MSTWSWRSWIAAALGAIIGGALLAVGAPSSSAAERWSWPVRGPVLTAYSNDNSRPYAAGMHRGIDISAPVGASVVAARSGRVTYAGALGSSGLTLSIETAEGGHATSYLHMRSIAVRRGQLVARGQEVGEVGTSGKRSAVAPHLHLGVRRAGRARIYVDPLTLLPPLSAQRPQVPVAAAPLPSPLREQRAPAPAAFRERYAAVPVGPRPRPIARPVGAPLPARDQYAPAPAGRRPAPAPRPRGEPVGWGPLFSLAGLLLLGAVLGRRLLRDVRSGARGRPEQAQPSTRSAPVRVSTARSVSQVG